MGAWKSNFPPFWEIMTDRPTNRPTDTERQGHREVTVPTFNNNYVYIQ